MEPFVARVLLPAAFLPLQASGQECPLHRSQKFPITKAARAGGLYFFTVRKAYCATPAGGCGAAPVVVAAAASFSMRW